MRSVFYIFILLLSLQACSESVDPQLTFYARVSGTPGMSFNGFGIGFQKQDTSKVAQDFIGNIPLGGEFLITFGNEIKGIEVSIQKESEYGTLKLEVFVNDQKTDSAFTAEPQGRVSLSAGDTSE